MLTDIDYGLGSLTCYRPGPGDCHDGYCNQSIITRKFSKRKYVSYSGF